MNAIWGISMVSSTSTTDSDRTTQLAGACPSEGDWVRFTSGRVSDREIDQLAEHLDMCIQCQSKLQEVQDTLGDDDSVVSAFRSTGSVDPLTDEQAYRRVIDRVLSGESASKQSLAIDGSDSAPVYPSHIGHFYMDEQLGKGGMGVVFKATDEILDCPVAVKIIDGERMHGADRVRRFFRERRAVASLDHPNIVRARTAGEENGVHYLVMDYVDGQDLQRLVKNSGPLNVADAAEIIRQAGNALTAIEDARLVHRDIKPSNLMIDRNGTVKVLDLGLARLREEEDSGLSCGDSAMGTADYVAPEQASPKTSVDIRADVYSLGCTFFFLLAGRAPFADEQFEGWFEKTRAHKEAPIPDLRKLRKDVPSEIVRIVEKMVAKDPAERFQSPSELLDALGSQCLGANLPTVIGLPKTKRRYRPISRVPLLWIAAVLTLAFSAFLIGQFVDRFQVEPVAPEWVKNIEPVDYPGRHAGYAQHWDSETEQLFVDSRKGAVIKLGSVSSQRYRLSVDIHQRNWPGHVGIVLGCRNINYRGRLTPFFQVIRIRPTGTNGTRSLEIVRERFMYNHNSGTFSGAMPLPGTTKIVHESRANIATPSDSPHRLELTVGPSGLESASWAGEQLDSIVTDSANRDFISADYVGDWGIYFTYPTRISKPKLIELKETNE